MTMCWTIVFRCKLDIGLGKSFKAYKSNNTFVVGCMVFLCAIAELFFPLQKIYRVHTIRTMTNAIRLEWSQITGKVIVIRPQNAI